MKLLRYSPQKGAMEESPVMVLNGAPVSEWKVKDEMAAIRLMDYQIILAENLADLSDRVGVDRYEILMHLETDQRNNPLYGFVFCYTKDLREVMFTLRL